MKSILYNTRVIQENKQQDVDAIETITEPLTHTAEQIAHQYSEVISFRRVASFWKSEVLSKSCLLCVGSIKFASKIPTTNNRYIHTSTPPNILHRNNHRENSNSGV